ISSALFCGMIGPSTLAALLICPPCNGKRTPRHAAPDAGMCDRGHPERMPSSSVGQLLQNASFAIVTLSTRMQRNRHAVQRLGRVDGLCGSVRSNKLWQVVEKQLGHLIGGFIGDT